MFSMVQIKHGFQGQRMIILPFYLVERMGEDPLMNDLYIHSLGYFPNARYHYIDRPNGCSEFILIYCTKGKGWFESVGGKFELHENQFVILSSETPHRYGSDDENPWSIYWIHFKGYKSSMFSELMDKPCSISPNKNSRIEDRIVLFEQIYKVLNDSLADNALHYANLCLAYFLGTILYLNIYRNSNESHKYGTSLANLATHYMNENIEKKLKLSDLAGYFGYSTSYFYRIFYKSIGYAPMEYFNYLKIQRACYYLINSSRQITEIALNLGFDDPYYFSRLFKKVMGVSPTKYKIQNKLS